MVVSKVLVLALLAGLAQPTRNASAQEGQPTPIRQSDLTRQDALVRPLTLREASRNDRWMGLGVRDVRWAPDGSGVYFRWNRRPTTDDVPEEDPWFRTDPSGELVWQLQTDETAQLPGPEVRWNSTADQATWVRDGTLYFFDGEKSSAIVALDRPIRDPRFAEGGDAVEFQAGGSLYRYATREGAMAVVAQRVIRATSSDTDAARWLAEQQEELFDHVRNEQRTRRRVAAAARASTGWTPQAIPVPEGIEIDQIQLSPDGAWVTFRATITDPVRPTTSFVDYVDESGYATVGTARPKAGEPRDLIRLGVVAMDPTVPVDSIALRWIDVTEAGDQATVPHGPVWNLEGTRAVAQFIGEDHEDVWFAELDLESATATVVVHDHDDAWIGGPPIQANRLQPALMEWLPGDRLVFASERSGWSHLYRVDPDGSVTALTEGAWEVRGARLTPDRETWLLQASREHPSEDHLYRMGAAGGPLERLTTTPGRHEGSWSPDGERIAVVSSTAVELPDLYLSGARAGVEPRRVSVSGTDAYYEHPLTEPEIVRFGHPDDGPLWAALFLPDEPNAERSAIIHVHGGGYRQFAHRGYSVYGYATHLGFINYMLEQGYTVLDFDYRGSAGFGRDYRTDISESMGIKDTDGAVAGARWLAETQNVDPDRIGIYGVSYGGFLTLTSLFRYPGVFSAGIARAAVTDWAHYSDGWTSRILGVPHENPEAYRRSSPIYYAEGLQDPLLITHGLVDDNVHFQDAARLIQRLIELEKSFEVMVYPVEQHTVETEAGRYDLFRRQAAFFDEKLRGISNH
jgi:dipeptidyl aminopeptidase/acylaminoacyl peptidase